MSWQSFRVVFRLRSPLHSGWGKVGNLQRTRAYITGRALWGALTMRLTRDAAQGNSTAIDPSEYRHIGEQVHKNLAFTYFFPALKSGGEFQVIWPWGDEPVFRSRFLSSYQATALSYPQQSASGGTLHEVEFISPHTLDTGEPVYLVGYVFEREGSQLDWQSAFKRLQLGGERGYGWGDVFLVDIHNNTSNELFDDAGLFIDSDNDPKICLPVGKRLLSHAPVGSLLVNGHVEPLVGREWRADHPGKRYIGQYVAYSGVCYVPGSEVEKEYRFAVKDFGLWKKEDK